jgi:hypothetical protein
MQDLVGYFTKINEGLVFDHHSWELIGFTDLQDDDFTASFAV